jgi:transcriptional regulator NrdR family protein
MAPATYAIGQEIWPNQIPQIPHCTNIICKAIQAYEKQLKNGTPCSEKADREKFLHELRARIALRKVKGDDQDKAISNIKKQLRNTKNFAAIKRAIKQQVFLPLNKVETEYEETTINAATEERKTEKKFGTIDTLQLLEDAILKHNQQHFSQSHGTPWTLPPFQYMGSETNFTISKSQTAHFWRPRKSWRYFESKQQTFPNHSPLLSHLKNLSHTSFTGRNLLQVPHHLVDTLEYA